LRWESRQAEEAAAALRASQPQAFTGAYGHGNSFLENGRDFPGNWVVPRSLLPCQVGSFGPWMIRLGLFLFHRFQETEGQQDLAECQKLFY
jgi:hypothetical protein